MWPRRSKSPRLAGSPFSAYLRGRLVGLGIGLPGEADLYASDDVPAQIRVAFALGVSSKRRAPIMAEREVAQAVRDRVDIAAMVAQVEGDDDPPGGGPPPAAPPPAVPVPVEGTSRLGSRRWIGDPLPAE